MTANKHQPGKPGSATQGAGAHPAQQRPDWADGLRALYNSVVEEPLPDSFQDLLDKLDDSSAAGST